MSDMLRDLSARWPWLYRQPYRQPIGVTRRGIAALACACVAIFVGFFAIGRATVPANAPQLQASTGFALTYSGASVPTGLSGVPSIATIAFAPARVRAASHTHAATAVPSPTHTAQITSPPAVEAPSAVVPSPTVSAPARNPQHSSGGSGSFDSSG
jgi:hypothetical protein